jgi:hypothetical protein
MLPVRQHRVPARRRALFPIFETWTRGGRAPSSIDEHPVCVGNGNCRLDLPAEMGRESAGELLGRLLDWREAERGISGSHYRPRSRYVKRDQQLARGSRPLVDPHD